MLYMTTRSQHDAYTAHKALTADLAPDSGLYIPYKLPELTEEELFQLTKTGFSNTVAHILNIFFQKHLSAWDIEFCLGKSPVKLAALGKRSVVVESWCNPGYSYDYALNEINTLLTGEKGQKPCSWVAVAVYIAYCFGAYAQMRHSGMLSDNKKFDVCVHAGDYTEAAAVMYCKQMGLPIEKTIIAAKENAAVWDLVNHHQVSTVLLRTGQKAGLERLICGVYGHCGMEAYLSACERHGVYTLPVNEEHLLSDKFFVSVISSDRAGSVAANVCNTTGYKLEADAAVCYAAVQDYRAKTGQGRMTLLFSHNPVNLS